MSLGFPLPSASITATVLDQYHESATPDRDLRGGQLALEAMCDSLATCVGSYSAVDVEHAHIEAGGTASFAKTPAQELLPRAIVCVYACAVRTGLDVYRDILRSGRHLWR